MSDPTFLYCVGATKAGTSWLYRTLHEHPECHVRAVKEVHYWDTFDAEKRDKQVVMLDANLLKFKAQREDALAAEQGWKVRNMDRRIRDMGDLITMLNADRSHDLAYGRYMIDGLGDAALVADMTPGYATVDVGIYQRMVADNPAARVLFLIRDPLARLWSHVRMQAKRQMLDGEDYSEKANNTLWRVLNKGQETHLLERGDYKGTIEKLRQVIPAKQLMVAFTESMFTVPGLAKICEFLRISVPAQNQNERVHQGDAAQMRDKLVPQTVRFLKDQYEWVAEHVGPMPAAWQASLARG